MVKVLDYANVYITDSYEHKTQIVQDLEEAKRVVVVTTQEDVASYFGLILEQYGQYNIYLEEDLSIVDDEYLDEISKRDRSKEEAIIFLGTPLSEMIIETIDELHLNDKQKRIMSLCKEVVKGSDDVKSKAVISALNDKLSTAKIEIENLQEEVNRYKTEGTGIGSSEGVIHVSTVNLDSVLSKTRIMYIREYSRVNFLDSLLNSYIDFLETMNKKKVKLIIVDSKAEYNYGTKYPIINTVDEYISAKQRYNLHSKVITKVPITPFIVDLYRSELYELIVILDKNVAKSNLVKGKNVMSYSAVYSEENLKYALEKDKGFKLITDSHLKYKDSIIIPRIKELTNPDLNAQQQLYYYRLVKNIGNEDKLIFDIFNDDNKIKVEKK